MDNYIKCECMMKKLKGNIVLDNISLSVKKGEFLVLKGHNGSGKTMILRAISGLMRLNSGFVYVDNEIIGKQKQFPDSMGILIEYPSFIPGYTGFQNLKFLSSINNKISDEEIYNIIQRVGLDKTDKRKYKRYSLGMKQRLGIAQALMERPKLLLLDEPTNALDSDGIKDILDILKVEKSKGTTIIVASHDVHVLDNEIVDRIVHVNNGKLVD
ncbi:ATP-binding cassette domain-containing protein [Bacillus sp. TH22]|uniref:ATP-binding cassette domain-containing protein n=1 Tax=unclassified Bacillus (in: firmicutes) TaxID=185979 RepID=UPI001913E3BC|nr:MULTISPECIES: ATP-binding cassette domain-containing protein [unclassified Bacillus (in: firmicutes)]MBK5361741.1 ATP-binding cassette domain-containing protein [Bacillus sp. TH44]MBK5348453.1 ATP-binding cassette domain-containing protein [Bacillus sp. TH45]MBK5364648.1 ATP-binding cassette domain-containing protein [Bacillus sp. TH50]MBK5450256.1 ATP-binding cassette domain-containing protein [Bacillus sp. TH22]MBK5455995.1 ATP-binding cassette domain-containing protein [Bacillus sp. TH23